MDRRSKGQFPAGIDNMFVEKGNRIKTNEFLKIEGYENVFVIGDVSTVATQGNANGHPQVAQVAIQQGTHLAETLINLIHGKALKPFKYKDKGSLATIEKEGLSRIWVNSNSQDILPG